MLASQVEPPAPPTQDENITVATSSEQNCGCGEEINGEEPSSEVVEAVEEEDPSKLSNSVISRNLSELGLSPDGLKHVFLKLTIRNEGISDIEELQGYQYIQSLCLSGNNLTDISVLGNMRYLVRLDVSNNKLRTVLGFDPAPYNLQEIDFSRNQIQRIPDVSVHRFLKSICLDKNLIREISGLSGCLYLENLSIASNGITEISHLSGLPIKYLDLRWNRIRSMKNFGEMLNLEEVLLAHNCLLSLQGLSSAHMYLRKLDVESNQLENLQAELDTLAQLPLLTELSMKKNPLANAEQRLMTAFNLPNLLVLDGLPLSFEEKVAAINLYNPPPSVVASLQHALMTKKQAKLYARIKAEDLMRATRLRPIVLCGPNGVGKRTLTSRLLKEFPHIFGLSVSHTTRPPRPGEENGVHYHFVSKEEMQKMIDDGKFVEVITLFGYMYGTSMEAIDKVTEEGKVCIMDLEIEGVLALKRSHLKPRYIFITVPSLDILQERLQKRLRENAPASSSQRAKSEHQRPQSSPYPSGLRSNTYSMDAISVGAPVSRGQSPNSARPYTPDIFTSKVPKSAASDNAAVLDDDVKKWLSKAKVVAPFVEMGDLFDLEIMNDDSETAYQTLRNFCHQHVFTSYSDEY